MWSHSGCCIQHGAIARFCIPAGFCCDQDQCSTAQKIREHARRPGCLPLTLYNSSSISASKTCQEGRAAQMKGMEMVPQGGCQVQRPAHHGLASWQAHASAWPLLLSLRHLALWGNCLGHHSSLLAGPHPPCGTQPRHPAWRCRPRPFAPAMRLCRMAQYCLAAWPPALVLHAECSSGIKDF